jgi:hypothetical protein
VTQDAKFQPPTALEQAKAGLQQTKLRHQKAEAEQQARIDAAVQAMQSLQIANAKELEEAQLLVDLEVAKEMSLLEEDKPAIKLEVKKEETSELNLVHYNWSQNNCYRASTIQALSALETLMTALFAAPPSTQQPFLTCLQRLFLTRAHNQELESNQELDKLQTLLSKVNYDEWGKGTVECPSAYIHELFSQLEREDANIAKEVLGCRQVLNICFNKFYV